MLRRLRAIFIDCTKQLQNFKNSATWALIFCYDFNISNQFVRTGGIELLWFGFIKFKILTPILFAHITTVCLLKQKNTIKYKFYCLRLRAKLICIWIFWSPAHSRTHSPPLSCLQRDMLCNIFRTRKTNGMWQSEDCACTVKSKQIRKLPVSNAQLSNIKTWKFIKCIWLNFVRRINLACAYTWTLKHQ